MQPQGLANVTPEQLALAKGFTRRVIAEGGDYTLDLLVRPDYDPDGTFEAFDTDEGDWLNVNGWLFSIDEA